MPTFQITTPEGKTFEITAPDGSTQQQVLDYAQKNAGNAHDPTKDMTGYEKFMAGAGKSFVDLYRGARQRLGMADQAEIDRQKELDAPLMNTGAGTAGNISGSIAAGLPTMFIPGANTIVGAGLIGGAMGGLQPTATGESVTQNMGLGAAGGVAGQVAGNLIGRAMRPVASNLSPEAQGLAQSAQARGIPLDAADLTGSRPLTTIRDVLAQLPLTADREAAKQATKQAAFNRAVSGTFGSSEDALTPAVLDAARSRIGGEFTRLSTQNNLQANQGLVNALAQIETQANRNMTPDVARVVNNHIDDVLQRIEPGDIINGKAYRSLDSEMGRVMRTSSNGDVRYGVGQIRDALREAMDQSISATDRQAWQTARREYSNLMRVAPLAARNETGDVSGRSLLAAALRGSKSSAFTGGGELGELGRIGRAFVAEQTPNSGTAQRSFYQNLLTNPLTTAWQTGVGGVSLPAQALLNSGAGQRYFSQGAIPISEGQRALLNALSRGGGAGYALLPSN